LRFLGEHLEPTHTNNAFEQPSLQHAYLPSYPIESVEGQLCEEDMQTTIIHTRVSSKFGQM